VVVFACDEELVGVLADTLEAEDCFSEGDWFVFDDDCGEASWEGDRTTFVISWLDAS